MNTSIKHMIKKFINDKRSSNIQINSIINHVKSYTFNSLVYIFDITIITIIFIISVMQFINDH